MPSIRPMNTQFLSEIGLRIVLLILFYVLETSIAPYVRDILPGEMELLKHPRHASFVPASLMWWIVLGLPCLLMICCWLYGQSCQSLEFFMSWSLAFGLTIVFTDAVKLIVGRPRPDFFYRCYPDGVVTKDNQCSGNLKEVMDGRMSFPSGHASLSFCSLGIISLWLCGQLKVLSRRGSGVRMVVTAMPLFLATGIALSRSCDYHHHWEDILVGSSLGFFFASFCYRQYYNPLTSDLSGIPYIVSNDYTIVNSSDSPPSEQKDSGFESTPLISGKKEDKWI